MSYSLDKNGIAPQVGELIKVSKRYSLNATTKLIKVNESDFKSFAYVINLTTNNILYIAGSNLNTGTTWRNELVTDSTASMSNNDDLYILYNIEVNNDLTHLLEKLITEQKKTNSLLSKIYQ